MPKKVDLYIIVSLLWAMVALAPTVIAQGCPSLHTLTDAGADSTIVVYHMETDTLISVNPRRALERFPPYSTFKVFNAMVALDTGALTNVDTQLDYDPALYPLNDIPADVSPFDRWREPHSLRTGMRYSVVWFYTEVARLIGQEQMQSYLDDVGYGNADASAWINERQFWLGNGLEISAIEQVDFLRRIVAGELPVAEDTLDALREIIIVEETDDYVLSGKTGTALAGGVAWFVGYVEYAERTTVFVVNTHEGTAMRDSLTDSVVDWVVACG